MSALFIGAVTVAPGSSLDVYFVPSGLTAAGTTCRLRNASTVTITASLAGAIPTVISSAATSIGADSATLNGEVISDGGATVTERGFCYKTTSGVTLDDNKSQSGSGTGAFSLTPTLSPNTQYYFVAYAINAAGTTLSTPELSFCTLAATPSAPVVGGPTPTTLNLAIGSGDGNPATTAYAIHLVSPDQYVQADGTLGASAVFQTAAAWGTRTVTGLSAGTLYTFEVKAINGDNVETGFGSQSSAATASGVCPTITLTAPPLAAATVRAPYTQAIAAAGSSSTPYTYAVTGGSLPAGLTLSSGGVISGTPTSSASATFTVTATDSAVPVGCTGSQEYTLTPGCPGITVTTSDPLPAGAVASAYSQQFAASGGNNSFTYAVTGGSLPGGLTLSASGLLSGTATTSGSFAFGITATDSSGCSGSATYHVTIDCATITLTTPDALPMGIAGQNYSQGFAATGGNQSFTFAKTSGTLPPGLTLSPGGMLSGTIAAVGTFTFAITATDSSGCSSSATTYSITSTCGTIYMSPSTFPNGYVGTAYSQALSASSGVGPYTYQVSAGALPGGVNLSPAGVISGTPSAAGLFTFDVTVTDAATACFSTRSYSLTVTLPPVVGWDVSPLPGGLGIWGPSPLSPSTTAMNITVTGLTRGSGVATPTGSTAAGNAWGGTDWVAADSATAISKGKFVTFTVKANSGYLLSLAGISKFDYRRSSSGPPSGLLQYSFDGSTFHDIAARSYTATSSSGGSTAAIDLSGIAALQNIPSSTTVTFRILNYGASGSAGTWYIFDFGNSTANDFEIVGAVVANQPPVTQNTSYTRASGMSLKIPVADILALCSDPENNTPITLQSVSSGLLGATVTADTTWIYYTPAADGADTLVYTVADSFAATSTGNISITTAPVTGAVAIEHSGSGSVTLRFYGIPGYPYEIQRSLGDMNHWQDLAPGTAAPNGLIQFTETPPSSPAYYRVRTQ